MSDWTLFSNHGHVLVCLARDPQARLRDVAASVGITERAVQKIVRDLQQADMISVSKQGRRNQYRIHRKVGLRHALEADNNIGGLIDFVVGSGKPAQGKRRATAAKPSALKAGGKASRKPQAVQAPAAPSSVAENVVDSSPLSEEPATRVSAATDPVANPEDAKLAVKETAVKELVAEKPATQDLSKVGPEDEKPVHEKQATEKSSAQKPEASKRSPKQKVTQKADSEKAKAEAISDIEKQQGSLF